MIGALVRNPRFWRDMFFDAVRENRRLQQLVETGRLSFTGAFKPMDPTLF